MLQMGEEACSFSLSRKLSSKWNFPDTRGTWKLFDEEKNAIALLPEEASISTWRDFLALTFFSFNWQLLSHLFLFRFFLAFHLFSLLVLSVFCFTFRYTWHETTTIKINTRAKTSFANPFVYRAKLVVFPFFRPTDCNCEASWHGKESTDHVLRGCFSNAVRNFCFSVGVWNVFLAQRMFW